MAKQKGSSTRWFNASPPSSMPGRIPLESLAGIAWNPWPESNGITGRDHVESVAGIVWNLHLALAGLKNSPFDEQALTAVHQGSGGLFRKANHLARGALIAAAAEKSQHVTADSELL